MATDSPPRSLAPFLLFLLACAVACVAVSSQSLWIDEAQTALKAIPGTLHGWWHALDIEHSSNMQLPLYMLYIWGWARVFGVSELALRAANIPWFFVGFFAISHFLRRHSGLRNAALLVFCVHPFVWYYLNEARPYLMQLSGALLVTGALFSALDQPDEPLPTSWWWLFAAGLTVLCGAGLLGVPWAAAITLLLIRRPGFCRSMLRSGLPALVVFVPLLTVLAIYLAWTLKENAHPGEQPMSLSSIPFVFYEHLGFVGLGPGRADMRSGGLRIFLSYLPSLCILGIPLIYAVVRARAARFGLAPRLVLPVFLVGVLPTAFVFALGITKHFRVLGRHLTPLLPFVLCGIAVAISLLWARRRPLDRAVAVCVVLALAGSALECRFARRHAKDDNRDAIALGKAALAKGEDVWWAGDPAAANYYGLPFSMEARPGVALFQWDALPAEVAGEKPPDLILLCKPDLFDANSGVRGFIAQHRYSQIEAFPAFSVWRR